MLSALFLASIVALLAVSNNRWVFDWPLPWKISSMIALLNSGFKASMMDGVVASLRQLRMALVRRPSPTEGYPNL